MNTLKIIVISSVCFSSILFAQEERKVLVEIFTNSHCPLCPSAHEVIDNYLAGPNGERISYIFFHMAYPYSDDPLNHQSMGDSQARDDYYNPVPATPRGFFDGIIQGSWSGWTAVLDNLSSTESPMRLALSGSANGNQITINSTVTRTGDVSDTDLVIHFVVVEDVFYAGRNGITDHIHVMRKMLPSPSGMPFSINQNESIDIDQVIDIDALWDVNDLSIVVFVQSTGSKTVYQSETIGYNDLKITGVEDDISVPNEFSLQQKLTVPSYDLDENIVYFLHIPKTAGTTLISIIDDHFNLESILHEQVWNKLLLKMPETFSQFKLIRGHFGYGLYRILPKKPLFLTMLREPVDRTLSFYEHIRRDPISNNWVDKDFLDLKEEISDLLEDPQRKKLFIFYYSTPRSNSPRPRHEDGVTS